MSKEEVLARWLTVMKEMDTIRGWGKMALLIDDLNKCLGIDEWGVVNNHDTISYGGQFIRDLLASEEYVLINEKSSHRRGQRPGKNEGDSQERGVQNSDIRPHDYDIEPTQSVDNNREG